MAVLEVCCYSMAYAQEIERCGVDRIKPCAASQEEGLTPSYGVPVSVREAIILPVYPVVRPHDGNFYYIEEEFAAMFSNIYMVRELGFPGVVTDVLDTDGQVDIPQVKKITVTAGPLAVTSHHAFDLRADPHQAWKTLGELGIKHILTSGQQSSTEKGISLITELIAAGDTLIIMAGAGVRAANLPLLLQAGVKEVHSSAGQWLPSEVRFCHPGISISVDPDADGYKRYIVNGEAVTEMKGVISVWRS